MIYNTRNNHGNTAFALCLVLSAMAHIVILTGLKLYSNRHPNTPPPPITEIIEVTMFEMPTPQPSTPEPVIDDPAPVVEPEPIIEEPQPIIEPEPIIEEPAPVVEPEPIKVVKPDTPVVPPPKIEKPEPKPVEPPKPVDTPKQKSREDLIRERFNNSPISNDSKQRQEQQKKQERERQAALNRLQNTLNRAATTEYRPSQVAPVSHSKVLGVSAAQMTQYNKYMANCVTPKVNALWQQFGPNGLDTLPTDAKIQFVVTPAGKVLSYLLATRSNSAAVNAAAEALGKALMQQGLPTFRQVGLVTEGNASLTIEFTLRYQR